MKKLLLGLVFGLFAMQANAAIYELTHEGFYDNNVVLLGIYPDPGNPTVASSSTEVGGGAFDMAFTATTDTTGLANVEWTFNPGEYLTTADLIFGGATTPNFTETVTGSYIATIFMEVGKSYYYDISGTASNTLGFQLSVQSVSEVPIPAAVWLFGSALMGLFGVSRRKSTAIAA